MNTASEIINEDGQYWTIFIVTLVSIIFAAVHIIVKKVDTNVKADFKLA